MGLAIISLTAVNFLLTLLPLMGDFKEWAVRKYRRWKQVRRANMRRQAVIHAIKEKERLEREMAEAERIERKEA